MKNKGIIAAFSLLMSIAMVGCRDSATKDYVDNHGSNSKEDPADNNPGIPSPSPSPLPSDRDDQYQSPKQYFNFEFATYDHEPVSAEDRAQGILGKLVPNYKRFNCESTKFFIDKVFYAHVNEDPFTGIAKRITPINDPKAAPSDEDKVPVKLITLGCKASSSFEVGRILMGEGVKVLAENYSANKKYAYYTFYYEFNGHNREGAYLHHVGSKLN